MLRRELLRLLGGAAFAPVIPLLVPVTSCASTRRISPLASPGIQLYTLRDLLARDLEGTLQALATMGYREVELAGLYGRPAKDFRAVLDAAGLTAPSGHMPIDRFAASAIDATLDEAEVLGHEYVVVPWVDPTKYTSADDWRRLKDTLELAGKRANERKFRLAYHNHDFELRKLPGGEVPLDILLTADPTKVRFEMDVFWVVAGGADPLAYIRNHRGRFEMLHIKDRAADGTQVTIGQGTIDFAAVLAEARTVRHAFVEHDRPADPMEFARGSINHLKTLRN
jgi:sugar phosphate isomerase/epimerase